jgi:hypothetical protein
VDSLIPRMVEIKFIPLRRSSISPLALKRRTARVPASCPDAEPAARRSVQSQHNHIVAPGGKVDFE